MCRFWNSTPCLAIFSYFTILASLQSSLGMTARFESLPVFADGGQLVTGISEDGQVVIGSGHHNKNGITTFEACLWTKQDGIVGLGDLPGGSFQSAINGGAYLSNGTVSADGSVVIGSSASSNGSSEAFRWTKRTGMEGLGDLDGGDFFSQSLHVSDDGSTILGLGKSAAGYRLFRWTQAQGLQPLPIVGTAFGASADGSVIVGDTGQLEAFVWSESTGQVKIGNLGGTRESAAYSVSADGSVVAGISSSSNGYVGFRWTASTGMVAIPGTAPYAEPNWMSADGSAIVGTTEAPGLGGTFYWSEATGTISLGSLPGRNRITINGVSADGSVVVGSAGNASNSYRAFYWTKETGMQDLRDMLIAAGATNLQGVTLLEARGISADGLTIAGNTTTSRPWMASLSPPTLPGDYNNDGLLTAQDVDRLSQAIREATDSAFDLNEDLQWNTDDLAIWVHQMANTYFGDADLDGQFNSFDLITVFQSGQYEDGPLANSTWSTGDWNGDAEFDSGDLVLAFQEGGYERGPRIAAVPEPTGVLRLAILVSSLVRIACVRRSYRLAIAD